MCTIGHRSIYIYLRCNTVTSFFPSFFFIRNKNERDDFSWLIGTVNDDLSLYILLTCATYYYTLENIEIL